MLMRLRDRGMEDQAGRFGCHQPNPSPTNGQWDGNCRYYQQLRPNESIHNALDYNIISWYNLISFIFSVLSMLSEQ